MKQWLDKAGAFVVEHVGGIPHFPQMVRADVPPTGVVHTTEGSTIEGAMGVFRQHYASHFVLGKDASDKVRVLQLVPIGFIGAALVSNNDHALVQVEVVGFSQTALWLPDPETLAALAGLMAACRDEYGIPLTHPWPDGDFGRAGDNPHRHAGKWGVVGAWYGHGDVPSVEGHSEETHWDPGALQWSKVFEAAAAIGPAVPTPVPGPPRPCPPDLATAAKALDTAIRQFQAVAGLTVDGDPGQATRDELLKALAS